MPGPGLSWRLVGREEIESDVGPETARLAIAKALAAGPGRSIPRSSIRLAAGELLLMPAEQDAHLGVKIVTLADHPVGSLPAVQGAYLLFDSVTLQPLAVLDGAALTELRTAAVSAYAIDLLAPKDAGVLALFGTGPQARAHLRSIAAVRELSEAAVVARSGRGVDELLSLAGALGVPTRRADPSGVGDADLVCCCTSSALPLFDGRLLKPGTVIVAVGSHLPTRREVDTATVVRSRVVVETRDAALCEAGDLLIPLGEGAFSPADVEADLFQLAATGGLPATGGVPAAGGVEHGRDLVLFKSVGVAFEDLAVADAVLGSLKARAACSTRSFP